MKTILLVLIASAPAWAGVRHVPPGQAVAGSALELVVEAPASTPALVVHARTGGDPQFHATEMVRRDDSHWVATVHAEAPELQYYIDAGGEPVFATLALPHTISVQLSDDAERERHDTIRSGGRRYRVFSSYERVDFGGPSDHYDRIDSYLAYRLWAYPLEEIRVGYTRLTGPADPMCAPGAASCLVGVKVDGWFELGLAPIEGIRFDARGIVMATRDGVEPGGRLEARLGSADASHVALGAEYLNTVGSAGYFRLGWATVPLTPMAATVEVTNMPVSTRATGVRFYYDVARQLGNGVRIGVRIGYAARVQQVAGISGGGGVTWDF